MNWLKDVMSGVLKGLDTLGRVRLYKNDGESLPYAQAPDEVVEVVNLIRNGAASGKILTALGVGIMPEWRYRTENEILLENGNFVLLENDDKIVMEV